MLLFLYNFYRRKLGLLGLFADAFVLNICLVTRPELLVGRDGLWVTDENTDWFPRETILILSVPAKKKQEKRKGSLSMLTHGLN